MTREGRAMDPASPSPPSDFGLPPGWDPLRRGQPGRAPPGGETG
jgi:hypothetical protein